MFEELDKETNDNSYYDYLNQNKSKFRKESMKIYIKTIIGKTITFNVSPIETVDNLKLMIEKEEGVPVWKQMLIYACKILEENTTLEDYNITEESSIFLIIRFNSSKIYITPLIGPNIPIDFDQTEKISSIKKKIENKENIDIRKQILIYDSNKLEDNKSLFDYGIKKESKITLVIIEDQQKLNEKLKENINSLNNKLKDEQIKIQNLEKKLKQVENSYNEEKKKYNDLNEKYKALENTMNSEKQKYLQVTNEYKEFKKKYDKLSKIVDKKRYIVEDFLEVKNFLEKEKEKEIKNIANNLMSVIFISNEEDIYWSINCNSNDKFDKLQNLFFNKYPEYNDSKTYFIFNGTKIKKEKSLEEIGIKNNDIIIMKFKKTKII